MSERYDVIIVGAGPAGLATAYFLVKKGFKVIVLERGSEPGSKNVFGGRIYSYVLDKYFSGWRSEAPVERWVRREKLSLLCKNDVVSLEYEIGREIDGYDSFTTFLSRFLKWMALRVEQEGAIVATSVRVDEVLFDDGKARGVRVGEDKLEAEYTVIAEGANTLLLEKHSLRDKISPKDITIGIKEVIKLGREKIEERFGLIGEEGLAQFLLSPLFGGGFIYTMKDYVSIGVVYRPLIKDQVEAKDVIEELRLHPSISKLIGDGIPIEYSAHIIREAGYRDLMSKPYGDRYLVVGDAAGLLLNTGFTIRGVDLAIESGRLAGEAIDRISKGEDPSIYVKLLRESEIIQMLKKFRGVPEVLSNHKIYTVYPEIACRILKNMYSVDESPITLRESIREATGSRFSMIKFILELLFMVKNL
ncbi:MAG: FAD-dependent oxidoreductase [Aigarchaeota archaeon]|nr:FAD-dependent oxidoreductase [Aigarchaeota archaeon]